MSAASALDQMENPWWFSSIIETNIRLVMCRLSPGTVLLMNYCRWCVGTILQWSGQAVLYIDDHSFCARPNRELLMVSIDNRDQYATIDVSIVSCTHVVDEKWLFMFSSSKNKSFIERSNRSLKSNSKVSFFNSASSMVILKRWGRCSMIFKTIRSEGLAIIAIMLDFRGRKQRSFAKLGHPSDCILCNHEISPTESDFHIIL